LTSLEKDELKIRGEALKSQRRSKAVTIKRLKERVESQRMENKMTKELINHLNEYLEYAQSNKDALGATIESGLLEFLTVSRRMRFQC